MSNDPSLVVPSASGLVTPPSLRGPGAGMAIYDTMQFVSNDVATVGLGLAA